MNVYGSNHKTAKSKLYDAAMEDEVTIIDSNNLLGIPNLENYFLDVVAFIRIMTNASGAIRGFRLEGSEYNSSSV